MRIMQTLLTALDARGMPVTVTKDGKTMVTVVGQELSIRLIEQQKQHYHPRDERHPSASAYDLVPTGELMMQIESGYLSKSKWRDKQARKVEECLNDFVIGLVEAALFEQRHAQEREERERRWAAAEGKKREQAERIRRLEDSITAWRRAAEIRAFVTAARGTLMVPEGSQRAEWLRWAEGYADSIDPLSGPSQRS
jgi:hypothetical protein